MWSRAHIAFAATGVVVPPTLYLMATSLWLHAGHSLPLYPTVIVAGIWLCFLHAIVLPMFTSPLRILPSAPGDRFFLGHTPDTLPDGRLEKFYQWMSTTENAGLIRVSGLFHQHSQVLVTRPEIAWEILTTKPHKFQKPGKILKWLTLLAGPTGLFTIEGKAHSVQRKTIQKVFTNTAVRNLTPTLWRKCINLGDEIQKRMNRTGKDDVTLDIQPLSAGATLDITAMLLFGKDTNCLEDEEEPMQKAWGLLTKPKATDGHLTFYFILQMLLPRRYADSLDGKFSRRFKSAVSDLRAYCLDIVTQRRNELQSEEKIDVLSLMLAEEKAFVNDDEVVDQLTTFLAAGHDTTTGAFLWALWLLSVEPEVQQKIRDEFRAIIDPEVRRGNAPFTAEMLDKLEYLTAVSSEVLRMFPTVPITPRVAQEDVVIGGVMMPKGTLLFMSAWALQRMEDVWGPEAGSFCPDRWLNGEHAASGGASAPHAFMSFISGPRSCIGQHLARYELRCMILSVLDRFDVARPPNTAPMGMTGIISNQPDRDLRLTFRKLE